jgi:hypothetical protein
VEQPKKKLVQRPNASDNWLSPDDLQEISRHPPRWTVIGTPINPTEGGETDYAARYGERSTV